MVLLPRFCTERKEDRLCSQHGTERTETIPAHLAERVRREVKTYQAVAVRDSGTAAFFDSNLPVVLDPTMLLDVEEWNKLAGDSPLIKRVCILLRSV